MSSGKVVPPILSLLAVVALLPGCDLISTVEITDCIVSIADFQLDKVEIEKIEIFLQGEGAELVVISIDAEEYTAEVDEDKAVVYCGWMGCIAARIPAQDSFTIDVTVLSSTGKILATRTFEKSISLVGIGDVVPNVKQHISLTLLWWRESGIAINGPYISGFYTFTARPGMKFLILAYRFKNDGIRSEYTPYLSAGESITSRGYIYSLWHPPVGILSEEYSPRESTPQEIQELVGNSGGYEELLPEDTVRGRAAFEIPEDQEPLEVKLSGVFPIISLG